MPPPPPPAKRGGKKGLAPNSAPAATPNSIEATTTIAPKLPLASPITAVGTSSATASTSITNPTPAATAAALKAPPPSAQKAAVGADKSKASGVTPTTLLADYDVQIEECRTFLRQLISTSKKGITAYTTEDPLSAIQFPLHATHHRRVQDTVKRLRKMQSKLIQEVSKMTGQAAARRVMEQYGGLQKVVVSEAISPTTIGSKRPRQ